MNLYDETIEVLEDNGKCIEDIDYINFNVSESYFEAEMKTIDFEEFKEICELNYANYDNGFGGVKVPECYIVFNDGSWLERGEYDGSEWWEYKETPIRINNAV